MVANILSQNSFWIVNKHLARVLGLDAAILLSEFITKSDYCHQEKIIENGGWFYHSSDHIKNNTTLSYYKQKQALNILKEYRLIDAKLEKVPARLYYRIIGSNIEMLLKTSIEKISILDLEKFKNKSLKNSKTYNNNKENNKERIITNKTTSRKKLPFWENEVIDRGKKEEEQEKEDKEKEIEVAEVMSWPSFQDFWDAYDKKVGYKLKLQRKWEGLSQRDKEEIMSHLPRYKLAVPDKQFRKNPETYLNNKSWNDEIIESTNSKRTNNRLTSEQRMAMANDTSY